MSRSLAANAGSLDSLKVRTRCGRSLCARQTRSTELGLVPVASAMALAVQWVASCGGSAAVSSTTRSIVSCARGGMRDGRVLSRSSPATPSRMNRSCQRQTHGFDLPVRRMISPVPRPSAVPRTILARQTCFCGLFRSATTASRRARSAVLTSTLIPSRISGRWGRARPLGIFRQTRSTRVALSSLLPLLSALFAPRWAHSTPQASPRASARRRLMAAHMACSWTSLRARPR